MREEDRFTWIFYRAREERIPDVYIASLAPGELSLSHLEGRFEDTIARAVRWDLVHAGWDSR